MLTETYAEQPKWEVAYTTTGGASYPAPPPEPPSGEGWEPFAATTGISGQQYVWWRRIANG